MRLLTIFCALSLTAQENPNFEKLSWIAGHWTGATGRANIEENWLPPAGGAMLGVSRTVAGSRMVAFEFLRIVQKDGEIYYIAQPDGRPPTEFKLTSASGAKAVFENPRHDHPKIITYERDADGNLLATIEGDEGGQHKKQQFRFRRSAK
ncbi:MAG: DUF6265 family protein [Bryobacteraceae bacterium]